MYKKKFAKKFLTIVLAIVIYTSLGPLGKVEAAASLYLSASTTTPYVGSTFTVYPRVNTGGAATNAYSINIIFSSGIITPVGTSKGGSICTLYTSEPSYTASSASISCGLPSPGYNGSSGGLGSISFKAIAKGSATISVISTSKVLANDGVGTNILGSTGSITINVTDPPPPPVPGPKVSASIGSDGGCINENSLTINWELSTKATGVSYRLTQNQSEGAGRTNMGRETSKKYTDLADGKYYFKIAATDGDKWSNDVTYTFSVDTVPPQNLIIESEPRNDQEIDRPPMISFNATDKTCGVDHYEIKLDNGEYEKSKSPYQFKTISSGEHTVTVKAVDKAGNYTEGSINIDIIDIPAPKITKPKNWSFIPLKDKLVVKGKAEPNSTVYIYLNGELIAEVQSDQYGDFSYTHDDLLPAGRYELYATLKLENGLLSPKSNIVKFTMDPYAIDLGIFTIPGFCLAIFAIFILILLIVLIILFLKRRKEEKVDLSKARKKIKREFDELERDVKGKIKKQDLSQAAQQRLGHGVKTEISEAEHGIKRALKDVGETEICDIKDGKKLEKFGGKIKQKFERTKAKMRKIWNILRNGKRKSKR